jgi:glycosyltransferase involved in cell wall biosynthesis
MRILWVKSDFLHPTTKGGQIRTLEMLRQLHSRHEIHYVAFDDPQEPEGVLRSHEYCSHAHPVRHHVPSRRSLRFAGQLAVGLVATLPVAIRRYQSAEMRHTIGRLLQEREFGAVVCDFLTPAVNFPELNRAILFQHNVESVIWERSAEQASNPVARQYLRLQARRMAVFEGRVCRAASRVIAVSSQDADVMRRRFAVPQVAEVPTGVDIDYFMPRERPAPVADLIFVGSMDWLPNVDAMRFFVRDVLPLIRKARPECSLAIVGRRPGPEILALADADTRIRVTGTVPDVRPYLWGSTVSIVPIRIGGGTRLKIYESMAARTPVVSTSIGAEGLDVSAPDHISLADTADQFARECVRLLANEAARASLSARAWVRVSTQFSWETVGRKFEQLL